MRIILFLAFLPDIIRGECKDTDNGAKDYKNEGCDWYTKSTMPDTDDPNKAWCGAYDDDDFKAHKMCCACKDSIYETVKVDVECDLTADVDRFFLGDTLLDTPELCAEKCQWCNEYPNTPCDKQNAECQYFQYSDNYRYCDWLKITSADCPVGFEKNSNYNLYKMKKNIVDEAKTNADLTKFVGAIEKAGLDKELQGDGPFTVFAPMNAAFEAKKDELENGDLKKILLRHVVTEKLMPYDIPSGITTKQTAGDETIDVIKAIFPAKNKDTQIVIKSSAGNGIVINQPIDALNGVIHIVNEIF